MAQVLAFPNILLDLTNRTPMATSGDPTSRGDFSTELSIAATRFELAVGVGAMIGGLVGAGIGAAAGCIVGAAPAGAVGAILGSAALGLPVGLYSWVQMRSTLADNTPYAARLNCA